MALMVCLAFMGHYGSISTFEKDVKRVEPPAPPCHVSRFGTPRFARRTNPAFAALGRGVDRVPYSLPVSDSSTSDLSEADVRHDSRGHARSNHAPGLRRETQGG
jgi:hypothetical protein